MRTLTRAEFQALTPEQRDALALTRRVQVARARQIHEHTFHVPARRAAHIRSHAA